MRAPHAAGAAGLRFLMPRLSIIIVTYNSRADVGGCLESLTRPGALAIDHEIVAVDNASTDGTALHLRERWAGVRVIEAGRNLGFAAANNVGIRQSSGELILLLNPDTIVTAGAIDRLVAVLDARTGAAIVGPRIVDASGHAELSFGRMISPFAELRQKLLVIGHDRGWPTIRSRVERMTRQRRSVDWVSGACLLIRRPDLMAVGLLDERFFMYTEDVDLCASVRARGRQVLFEPDVEIVHLRGRSVATARSATSAAYRQSQLAFYEKHQPRWAPVLRRYLKLRGQI
jgi:N-acetylglucosaminyl-diphospho-decaprenol L-rhamnosyltransferase